MKKTYFSILALSLSLAILTACGAQAKQPDEPPPAPQAAQTEAVIPDPAPEQPAEPAPQPIADIEPIAEPETVTDVEPEPEPEPEPAPENPLTFTDCNETVYAISTVNLRVGPGTDYEKIGSLSARDSVTRTGVGTGDYENWSRVILSDGTEVYVSSKYVSTTKPAAQQTTTQSKPSGGTTSTSTPSSGGTTQSTGTSGSSNTGNTIGQGAAGLLGSGSYDPSQEEGYIPGTGGIGNNATILNGHG